MDNIKKNKFKTFKKDSKPQDSRVWWSSAEGFEENLTFKSQAFTFYLVCKFMSVESLINIKLSLKRKVLEY